MSIPIMSAGANVQNKIANGELKLFHDNRLPQINTGKKAPTMGEILGRWRERRFEAWEREPLLLDLPLDIPNSFCKRFQELRLKKGMEVEPALLQVYEELLVEDFRTVSEVESKIRSEILKDSKSSLIEWAVEWDHIHRMEEMVMEAAIKDIHKNDAAKSSIHNEYLQYIEAKDNLSRWTSYQDNLRERYQIQQEGTQPPKKLELIRQSVREFAKGLTPKQKKELKKLWESNKTSMEIHQRYMVDLNILTEVQVRQLAEFKAQTGIWKKKHPLDALKLGFLSERAGGTVAVDLQLVYDRKGQHIEQLSRSEQGKIETPEGIFKKWADGEAMQRTQVALQRIELDKFTRDKMHDQQERMKEVYKHGKKVEPISHGKITGPHH